MNDIFLLFVLVTVFAVASIEWIPRRYGVFLDLIFLLLVISTGIGWLPEWYGWVVLLIGIAQLAWIYFSPQRRKEWPTLFSAPIKALRHCALALTSAGRSLAGRMPERRPPVQADATEEKDRFLTLVRIRNGAGAVCSVVLSPIAAIPSALVLSVLLVGWDVLLGNAPQAGGDLQAATKQVFGVSFVTIVAAIDLLARYWLISAPLLLAGGYAITAYSIGSGAFWRRYSRGLLLFGTVFPILYVAASVFGWFDGPLFN